jgi:hypothetical protein
MVVTDSPEITLCELESAIINHMSFVPNQRNHLVLELSPEQFLQWSTESCVGLVLALSIVLQDYRGVRHQRYAARSDELLTFLRKGLNALRYMEAEISKCIAQIE